MEGNGLISLFGNRLQDRQVYFDINILPMNLSDGRNIGDLSGLFLFTAPKKAESSRKNDILFILFYVENIQVSEPRMKNWAELISDTYFSARGSFTMGISAAVKKLSAYLGRENKGQIMPSIFMNAAVLRERTLMIAHAGPVHTTVISSDRIQNFNEDSSLPIQLNQNDLNFFTSDVHSEDIILLCPRVPSDWTNSAIMEVTGDSPLNAIHFLLDRSGGNLQAAVIQLKTGKGQIIFRTKTSITANIQEENAGKNRKIPDDRQKTSDLISRLNNDTPESPAVEKPLFRKRRAMELFDEKPPEPTADTAPEGEQENPGPDTQEDAAPAAGKSFLSAEDLPYDFSVDESIENDKKAQKAEPVKEDKPKPAVNEKQKEQKPAQPKPKGKLNGKRLALVLVCGLLIPIVVVSALFFIYSGRSKDQMHREYLQLAVTAAQKALAAGDVKTREALWTETISYTDQALTYGNSPACRDLRREAMSRLDDINGGISTTYNYANQNKLPQGLNIVEIATSGQYTYALDSASGSVLRFSASGNGLALDSNFTCVPGAYAGLEKEDTTIKVNGIVDFVILPSGNPHGFVLAGIDSEANILYCSGMKNNRAAQLKKPAAGLIEITGLAFSNNAMYVLDAKSSAVWEYLFNGTDGFIYEPSNYYGSYSPYLADIVDFAMFREFSYFLRNDGTLLVCDYTGYRPDCSTITEIQNENGSAFIGMANHRFKKILVNNSPDNSVYIMDEKLQTVLNLSVKMNYIRYITPNRSLDEISQYSNATGFGITGQNRLLWSYRNDLYIGNMP